MGSGADDRVALLESLPVIAADATFRFGCHPGVECFNECCADLDCVLGPYDVLRLRAALGLSGRQLTSRHTRIAVAADTGLPVLLLKMNADERRACPFVGPAGCTVYADRPAACRAYPIGRGTAVSADGRIEQRYALVREPHCRGFAEPAEWTPAGWLADQGLAEYDQAAEAYLRFVERWRSTGEVLDRPRFSMVYFGLYHLDEFATRAEHKGWFDQLGVPPEQRAAILGGGAPQLAFALEWLGAVLEV